MKMTYGSIIRKETRPFYMALNTILAYEYEYNGGIRIIIIIIISDEYKLKVNKWCLYQAVFVLHVYIFSFSRIRLQSHNSFDPILNELHLINCGDGWL